MKSAIVTLLDADGTLTGYLTGGIYATQEISRQATPDAYDSWGELKPCALVKGETQTIWGPHEDSSRLYVRIFLYERSGYASIDPARRRIYALLHRQKLTGGSDGNNYWCEHAGDVLDQEDEPLEAALQLTRFMLTMQRS